MFKMSDNIDNEGWLVQKTHYAVNEKDIYDAKCWLVTAKCLYPSNFKVQYEAYLIEKDAKRVKEAAELFLHMLGQFSSERILAEELCKITEALETKEIDQKSTFLKDMFNSLSRTSQKGLLINAAAKQSDCSEKCRLTLLLIKQFPEAVKECAVSLIQSLMSKEREISPDSPINIYRKLLVCNALPVVVSSEQLMINIENRPDKNQSSTILTLSPDQVLNWLELSIQYIICCQAFRANVYPHASSHDVDPSIHNQVDLWLHLHELLCIMGNKCGWVDILRLKDILSPNRSVKDAWSCLSEIHHNLKKSMKVKTKAVEEGQASPTALNILAMEKIGVFYAAVTIFFRAVWQYCKIVNRMDENCKSDGGTSPAVIVLLENLVNAGKSGESSEGRHPPKKKRKPVDDQKERQQVHLNVGSNCMTVEPGTCDYFLVAADTWHMLHSHSDYKNEFSRLLDSWRVDDWQWIIPFQVDRHIYRGKFKKAIEILQDKKESLKYSPSKQSFSLRCSLQLSSVYSSLGEHKKACSVILEALETFWEGTENLDDYKEKQKRRFVDLVAPRSSKAASSNDRFLELVECTEDEALSYCVQLLINSLKARIFSDSRNDKLLGHLIVLLQYDWPKCEDTFFDAVKKIQTQEVFKYPCFFDYIIVIDILEEFAYLCNDDSIQIELLRKSSSSSRRTLTRGSNKGAKEDLKTSLEKQVSRANESIESILRLFFIEERSSLI
ncbi:integrator complex subunit 10-like isoform X2 [Xenia sp. Carnegie-2017]|uniref:integrator complex subunit 10-like isoform X2 n=1 Tax=Xenia sp. Carnegie-2017 TaxID=2897299 RepID=UPI001F04FBF7|nr:integrator complex subunit 10-like isoform X2 [Xenia sp. Carnegie-2017]